MAQASFPGGRPINRAGEKGEGEILHPAFEVRLADHELHLLVKMPPAQVAAEAVAADCAYAAAWGWV
jgi:hypothetical protein